MKKIYSSIIILLFTICFLTSCKFNLKSDNSIVDQITQENNDSNQTTLSIKFPDFSSVALNDNVVTQDIFANKDITILNIWGTYCSPCINEMPELATWNKELPDNVQLIGLVIDVDSETKLNKDTALEIVNTTAADYTHILYNNSLNSFLVNVMAIPTTLFIDKEANILGEPIVGAYVRAYKDRLDKLLNE